MPYLPPSIGLRYVSGLRALPPSYWALQGNIQFTDYNYPQCAPPSGHGGFRQGQSSYRYGPALGTTSTPESIVSGLTFGRPESQNTTSLVGAKSQRESGGEPPHGEDIPDLFGIVEHLWAPLEWAETYYPAGPALPTKAQEVEVSLPSFRPVTFGIPLGDIEVPQPSHHYKGPNPGTQMMFINEPSPAPTPSSTSTAPSSSTSFWNRLPFNKQLPSNTTSPAAGSSVSGSSSFTQPKEILAKRKPPQALISPRTRRRKPNPQVMPRWQRILLEERDYPNWYDIPGVNKSFDLNGPSVGEAVPKPVGPYERPISTPPMEEPALRPCSTKKGLHGMCWGLLHTALASCMEKGCEETMVASAQAAWLYERESSYNAEEYGVWGLPMGSRPESSTSRSSVSNESFETSDEDAEEGGVRLDT